MYFAFRFSERITLALRPADANKCYYTKYTKCEKPVYSRPLPLPRLLTSLNTHRASRDPYNDRRTIARTTYIDRRKNLTKSRSILNPGSEEALFIQGKAYVPAPQAMAALK